MRSIVRLAAAALVLSQSAASYGGAFAELSGAADEPGAVFEGAPRGALVLEAVVPDGRPRRQAFEERIGEIIEHRDCGGFLSCFGAGLAAPVRTPLKTASAGADYGSDRSALGGAIGGFIGGLIIAPITVVSGIAKAFYKLFHGELL